MRYNEAQYNEQPYLYYQLSEVLTLTDLTSKEFTKILNDTTFLSNILTKQVTNKELAESILLFDWFSKKQTNQEWFD